MITRDEFDSLLAEHQQLIELANDLELCLYRLGESPPDENVAKCQQSAGTLIGVLRNMLFHQDQTVFPLLDPMTGLAPSATA
jgi:Hemerythrin HHE cation binding domain